MPGDTPTSIGLSGRRKKYRPHHLIVFWGVPICLYICLGQCYSCFMILDVFAFGRINFKRLKLSLFCIRNDILKVNIEEW